MFLMFIEKRTVGLDFSLPCVNAGAFVSLLD